MLFTSTVDPGTFTLLKELMKLKGLAEFALVGGTALSLKFGHRKSEDLDLFSLQKLSIESLRLLLKSEYGNDFIHENPTVKFAIFCYINGVKTDLVYYPHPLLKPIETVENIRMYSLEDIAAMKINAVLGRGVKKDFFDIVELLNHFSMKEIIQFHRQKFPDNSILISIPSALTYFEDAENSPDPISLKGQTWYQVKKTLQQAVRDYLQ